MNRSALLVVPAIALMSFGRLQPQDQPPPAPDVDALLEMVEAMSRPVEAHAVLGAFEGQWTYTGQFTMGPGAPRLTLHGQATGRWILGRRFLVFESRTLPDSLLPMESMSVFGYDTRVGRYTVWGIDTLGTYSVSAQGEFDPKRRVFELHGESAEPGLGVMPFRFMLTVPGEDRFDLAIEFPNPAAQGEWMTIASFTYTRQAP